LTPDDAILVRVLAQTDALRLPVRNWKSKASAGRLAGLELLASKGVPFRINAAGDEAGRKRGERDLVSLADRGLLNLVRGKAKWPHVRLTPSAEARARALCDLPDRRVGRMVLAAVAARTDREPLTFDRRYLAETALNGDRGWGFDASDADRRGLSDTELDYLPAAAAGWLWADSDIEGHGYYHVLPAGWAELDNPTADPPVGRLPSADEDATSLYRDSQDTALGHLATDPVQFSIGSLPLPVSMRGVRFPTEAHERPASRRRRTTRTSDNQTIPINES